MKDAACNELGDSKCWNEIETADISCQADQQQYRSTCTCRRHKKTQIVCRPINTGQSSIDLGIERVKVVRRKKVVVYLPEYKGVLNVTKKISSKCLDLAPDQKIGGNFKNIQTKDTSNIGNELKKNKVMRSDLNIKKDNALKRDRSGINIIKNISNFNKDTKNLKNNIQTITEKSISSNSSIEQIYNLESSTSDNSKVSNELNVKDCNSLSLKVISKNSLSENPTPVLRKSTTFETDILKQGLSWIRESAKDLKVRVNVSKAIRKDVSITCSPPSLIARSLSSTKVLNNKKSSVNPSKIEVLEDINNKDTCNKGESKAEDVKTMFSFWDKKFNFTDESNVSNQLKTNTIKGNKIEDIKVIDSKDTPAQEHKKSKNIFSFLRKKKKDKNINSFKDKKVTAGRCELSDGIVIKIAVDNNSHSITSSGFKKSCDTKDDKYILQQSWLKKFITNTGDSRKSLQLRWGNKLYGGSSNTVSELNNYSCQAAVICLKSKSDIMPNAYANTMDNTNFKQDIKACMMPNTICRIPVNKRVSTQKNHTFSSHYKKFIGKSKNHIEVFLPARHFATNSSKSSDYVTIHIPEEYFSEESEDQNQNTDEEVYNIVDYESQKSNISKEEKFVQKIYTGDYLHNNIKEKRQTTVQTCREVVIQGSYVCVPKVIGVGVITQSDMSCLEKSMKSQNHPNESQHLRPQKKCDLAETYLRDCCRNVMPLDLDLFASQMSKSQWQLISLNSSDNYSNNDLCIHSNIMSCNSSTEQGRDLSKIKECKQIHTNQFFSKLRNKSCGPPPPCNVRTCPKDSIEVCKKRKIYACSNKSKWGHYSTDEKSKADTKESAQSIASSDENCMDPCTDDIALDGILKFKGTSDCSNCKNNEKITKTATVIPDPICQIPQPPCLEKCSSVKKPICTKTSSPTCQARSPECMSPKSKISQTEPSETKVTQTKSPRATPSSSHAICLNSADSNAKQEEDVVSPITCFCSGDENDLSISESMDTPKKDSRVEYNPPPTCPLDPNSYCCCKPNRSSFTTKSNAKLTSLSENRNTTTTFYQKSLVNGKRIRCNCIGKRNVVTSKCDPDDPNCHTKTDSKKGANNLSAKPSIKSSKQSKNQSDGQIGREGLEEERNEEGVATDSKKSKTSKSDSTKEKIDSIAGVNCDDIRSTKEKINETDGVNCDEIIKDVYKDPCDIIKTPTQEAKEQKSSKSLEANTIQRKISVSDIIEINICVKFRNPESSKVQIRPHYAFNVDEKSDIQNIKTASSQIYRVYQKEGNQIKGQNEDINFTINIQTVKPECDLLHENIINSCYTATFKDSSINYSEHLLNGHQPVLDFANSANKVTFENKQIANFEISFGTDNFTSSTTHSSLVNKNITGNSSRITTDHISEARDIHSHHKHKFIRDTQNEFEKTTDSISQVESIKDIVNRKLIWILKKLDKNGKKEVFKQIVDTVGNMKSKNKAKNVKRIKHMMYAVLTSESDIKHINDEIITPTPSTRNPIDNSSKSISLHSEMFSESDLKVNTSPTHETSNESNDVTCVSNGMKDKIKRIISYYRTGCCCNKKGDIEEKSCCCNKVKVETKNHCWKNVAKNSKEISKLQQSLSNQNNKENYEEKAVKDSITSSEMESITMTEMSTTMCIESKIVSASSKKVSKFSSSSDNTKKAKQGKFVFLASDKVLFFLSDSNNHSRPEDFLQLRKTKRAVLKIYSQRSSIIKLPKFVSHRECGP